MIDLPEGYQARPLRYQDAAAVVAVMSAQQRRDLGEVAIELADIEADWQRPSFDLAASTVGVFTADRLVAYAEVGDGARGDASVHPEHEGRGIGTALAHWMQPAPATWAASGSGCRCLSTPPQTVCWPRSATSCAGRAGS